MLMWNKRYINIPQEIECPDNKRTLLLKDASLVDKNTFIFIKQTEEQKAIAEGVPTEKEIMDAAKQGGSWTNEDDLIEREIDKHIAFLESEVRNQKFEVRRKKIKVQLDKAKEQKKQFDEKVQFLKSQTAEHLAYQIAIYYLVQKVTLDIQENIIWNYEIEFLDDLKKYPEFIFHLAHNILSENFWPIKDIREVAKNPEWRMLWVLNKENLTSLFSKNLGELNINQKMLIYWSRVYDMAFESTDRPEFDIIQDDDKFDNWLINREQNNKNDGPKTKDHMEQGVMIEGEYIESCTCGALQKKGRGLGETPRHTNGCLYGVFRKYTQEEKDAICRQVYGENSSQIRKYINSEADKIEQAGSIQEHHLRNKQARKLLGAKSKVTPYHKP